MKYMIIVEGEDEDLIKDLVDDAANEIVKTAGDKQCRLKVFVIDDCDK